MALIANWCVMIALVGRIEIRIGKRIQQEIRAIKARNIGAVVVINRMCIKEFSDIIGVVSSLL